MVFSPPLCPLAKRKRPGFRRAWWSVCLSSFGWSLVRVRRRRRPGSGVPVGVSPERMLAQVGLVASLSLVGDGGVTEAGGDWKAGQRCQVKLSRPHVEVSPPVARYSSNGLG